MTSSAIGHQKNASQFDLDNYVSISIIINVNHSNYDH